MAYELLKRYTRADEAVKVAHVAAIKRKHGGRGSEERTISNTVAPAAVVVPMAVAQGAATASGPCPSCGGELKLYQGRRADYWGCVTCGYRKNQS